MLEVESHLVQQGFVERFEKTQVVMGWRSLCPSPHALWHVRLRCLWDRGDDRQVFAFFQFTPFAYGDFFQRTFPVQ